MTSTTDTGKERDLRHNPIGRVVRAARSLGGRLAILICVAGLSGACGVTPRPEYPSVHGRRAHLTTLASESTVSYRVGAYELVFADQPDTAHVRRAALVVSLLDGQGHVEGFAEWGRPGESPKTYAVGGWARQRVDETSGNATLTRRR